LRRAAAAVGLAVAGALAAGPALAEAPQLVARAAPTETTNFDVYFPPQHQDQLEALIAAQVDPASATYHQWLTPAQFKAKFGVAEATIAKVESELRAAGFTVGGRKALSLHVEGSVGAVEAAFGVRLSRGVFADGTQKLVADHPLTLTASLAAAGAHIAQYTTAPSFRRHLQVGEPSKKVPPPNFRSIVGPYYTADLRQAYDFPSVLGVDGSGVTIGVLMQGDWNEQSVGGPDMALYFQAELAGAYVPNITTVNVGGGAPFSANSDETHLDIQQSSGIALGATEVLYNLSTLGPEMALAGLAQISEDNLVDVVNQSFGFPEAGFLAANNAGEDLTWLLVVMHSLYLQGNSQGITFVASSGDHGAIPPIFNCKACSGATTLSVECPACDPDVTSVGGTNLVTAFTPKSNNSAYVSENANSDVDPETKKGEVWGTGGGVSVVWAKPTYQMTATAGFTTPGAGRTVPDLALHMGGCQAGFAGFKQPCPADRSSDWLWLGGQASPVIGTSASGPDIVGMFALMVNLNGGSPKGRLGLMNPYIYGVAKANGAKAFRHAKIPGSNGGPGLNYKIRATVPYDLVIGNGTVDARQFMEATGLPPSGIPGDVTNP
jgi:subtilase family serine protease